MSRSQLPSVKYVYAFEHKSMIGGYRTLLVMNSLNPLLISLRYLNHVWVRSQQVKNRSSRETERPTKDPRCPAKKTSTIINGVDPPINHHTVAIWTEPTTPLHHSLGPECSLDPNMDRSRTGHRILHQIMWFYPLATGDQRRRSCSATEHDNTNGPTLPKPANLATGTTRGGTQSRATIHRSPRGTKKTHLNQKSPDTRIMGRSHGGKIEPPRLPSTTAQQHLPGNPTRHLTFWPLPGTTILSR